MDRRSDPIRRPSAARSAEAILVDTLVPNREIVAGDDLWSITMTNGEAIAGVIGAETPTSVTLRLVGGAQRTIETRWDRDDGSSGRLRDAGGFDQQIDPASMAHLLAFLAAALRITGRRANRDQMRTGKTG